MLFCACFYFFYFWYGMLWKIKRSLKILKRSKLVNCVHKKKMFAWRYNHSNSMVHEYSQVVSVSISNSTNWKSFEHPNKLDKNTTLAQLMTWGSIWLTNGSGKSLVLETCLKTVIICAVLFGDTNGAGIAHITSKIACRTCFYQVRHVPGSTSLLTLEQHCY